SIENKGTRRIRSRFESIAIRGISCLVVIGLWVAGTCKAHVSYNFAIVTIARVDASASEPHVTLAPHSRPSFPSSSPESSHDHRHSPRQGADPRLRPRRLHRRHLRRARQPEA